MKDEGGGFLENNNPYSGKLEAMHDPCDIASHLKCGQ